MFGIFLFWWLRWVACLVGGLGWADGWLAGTVYSQRGILALGILALGILMPGIRI